MIVPAHNVDIWSMLLGYTRQDDIEILLLNISRAYKNNIITWIKYARLVQQYDYNKINDVPEVSKENIQLS
jgi:uncharacterized protein YqgQ